MKKVSTKKYRTLRILDYFGVTFLGLLMLLLWQLYKGPIPVPYLKPYIIKALNSDDANYHVSLDSVNIELVRSIQPIKIIANNIVFKKNDDSFVINAPRTSLSFSIRALLRGIIAPSSIEVDVPSIYVFTTYGIEAGKKNEINKKKIEYYLDMAENFLERFNSGDKYYAESYINSIVVNNAAVEFHEVDLGRKWVMPDVNYNFQRNFANISTDISALLRVNGRESSVGLSLEYQNYNDMLDVKTYFSDIVPSELIGSFVDDDVNNGLYKINLPVSATIDATIDFKGIAKHRDNVVAGLDSAVKKIRFQIEGGQGNIMFNSDEKMRYDISSFVLNGSIDGGIDKITIKDADFDLSGLKTKLGFDISGFKKYFIENSLKNLKMSVTAEIKELKIDDLNKYWPRYIVESAWNWCKTSLFTGTIHNAAFKFDFAYDPKIKNIAFAGLDGKVDVSDAEVNYLAEMPNIYHVYGQARFTTDSITVNLDKGVSEGVILTGGHVNLYDLDKDRNYADISLIMESSVTDALKLIDSPPLNFVKDMQIPAEKLTGRALTDLRLNFELKDDLLPEEVKTVVKASLSDVKMKNIIENKSLTAKDLTLKVTNQSLNLAGNAVLDDIPVTLVWNENFTGKQDKSRYEISFRYDDEIKKKLGIDVAILNPPYIDGFANVKAVVAVSDSQKTTVNIEADLQNAGIDYSFLGFRKVKGVPGNITTELNWNKDRLTSVPSFTLTKYDFNLKGKIDLNKDGSLKVIDIYQIFGPKTNAKAKIEFSEDKAKKKPFIRINVSGMSYDLTEFFERRETEKKKLLKKSIEEAEKDEQDELEKVTDTDIFIAVNKLWTNPDVPISNFAGSAKLRNGIGVYEVHMIGNYGNSKQVKLKADYVPRPNNEFYLSIDSNNAGSTFKVLRIYDNMTGGNLRVEAKRNADKDFIGHASIRDFNIHNMPVLAKVLTVASFSGMVNMLTGEGIAFSHFDAPFEYKDKVLSVQDSKAFGNVLGITISGSYNGRTEELNGKGVIAPAYSINSFLGRIPVVGSLLSGKDGTVFAANYSVSGTINDPKVNINPLSALSPNSLKELFASLFGNGENG